MEIFNLAVLLMYHPQGDRTKMAPDGLGNAADYRRLFFDRSDGLSNYWSWQSDGHLLVTGQVYEWLMYDAPEPPAFSDGDMAHHTLATYAVRDYRRRGLWFGQYDAVMVVVSGNFESRIRAAASYMMVDDRSLNYGIVFGDSAWQTIAHELGHTIGLGHPYGPTGEYGHPLCVMGSPGGYGYTPAELPEGPDGPNVSDNDDPHPSLTRRGPSLNAASALDRGWITGKRAGAIRGSPATRIPPEGEEHKILSRSVFMNRRPPVIPKALIVERGRNRYVLEYRRARFWDTGLIRPHLILTKQFSASEGDPPTWGRVDYVSHIALHALMRLDEPMRLGNVMGDELECQITAWDPEGDDITVRIVPTGERTSITVSDQSSRIRRIGFQNFDGQLCRSGTWMYRETEYVQEARIRYNDASITPISLASCVISERGGPTVILNPGSGTADIWFNSIGFPRPDLGVDTRDGMVKVDYDLMAMEGYVELRVRNRAGAGRLDFRFQLQIETSVGLGITDDSFRLRGLAYEYPQTFHDSYRNCLSRLKAEIEHAEMPAVRVILPPDVWEPMDPQVRDLVDSMLDRLAMAYSREDKAQIGMLERELEERMGIGKDQLMIASKRVAPIKGVECSPQDARAVAPPRTRTTKTRATKLSEKE
ncbi:hypothetical protein [Paracoccus pacificus]|uniref:Metallo-peptidase family M12B Reprolysin-like n=1 Tax=Paracoccus pacificus TaxID=1463598 RepID=A0ABW4RBM6_9RHOB